MALCLAQSVQGERVIVMGDFKVRPAAWMVQAHTYTAYKSELYAVEVAGVSCMVTNTASGIERHFQGDDATDILGAIEVIPARVPESQIVTATDHYLSQYFG